MSNEYFMREIKAGAVPISAPILCEDQRGASPPAMPIIQAVLPLSPDTNSQNPTPPPLPPPSNK